MEETLKNLHSDMSVQFFQWDYQEGNQKAFILGKAHIPFPPKSEFLPHYSPSFPIYLPLWPIIP